MATHSSSPWEAVTVYVNNEPNRTMIYPVKREWGAPPIADCGVVQTDEERANVRLLVAAPKLLEALYKALPFVEDAEDDPCYKEGYAAKAVKELRDAIASAEG